jgi:hypothetical protein
MRRTFNEPRGEPRLDGKNYKIVGLLFYRVDAQGRLVRGNSQQIVDPTPGEPTEALRDRFRSFEEALAATPPPEVSAKDIEALRALGYAH